MPAGSEDLMRGLIRVIGISGLMLFVFVAAVVAPAAADDHTSFVIVYKNGRHQTLSTEQVTRISLKAPATILYKDGHREKLSGEIERIEFSDSAFSTHEPGRSHYIGKWEVGEGVGHNTFFITLEADGDAKKSIGAIHGTWTLVDGEARIIWDDGWRDVIRKVGSKHEKRAYEPGRSFDDEPSNVTEARNTAPKPI